LLFTFQKKQSNLLNFCFIRKASSSKHPPLIAPVSFPYSVISVLSSHAGMQNLQSLQQQATPLFALPTSYAVSVNNINDLLHE